MQLLCRNAWKTDVSYLGSYAQMGEATAAVASWINENGYRVNGPMFNVYHVSPNETKNPDEYVTELCFPIE